MFSSFAFVLSELNHSARDTFSGGKVSQSPSSYMHYIADYQRVDFHNWTTIQLARSFRPIRAQTLFGVGG